MNNDITVPHSPLDGERPDISFPITQQSTDERVSIIVVHRDKPNYLNICLQSIAVASLNNNYEVIVVDNGSTLKDAVDFLDDLEEQGEFKVIRNKENHWWSKAANQGAKAADAASKYYIFMHADVVVLNPAWIDFLINVAHSGNGSGLVGVEMHSYFMDKQKIDFVEEWCMLVSKECWKDCGPFAEELPMIGHAFMFTMSAQLADYKPQVIKDKLVHHYRIFGMDISEYERFSEQAMVTIPNLMRGFQAKRLKAD